jgi:hypothetical protein
MPLNSRERKAIRHGRDENQPQLPLYDEKLGWNLLGYCAEPKDCNHLEVNHITNQSDGGVDDDPRNLITIPKCIHVGVCPSGLILDEYALKDKGRFRRNSGD